jgi:gliding motility-associated-like protein
MKNTLSFLILFFGLLFSGKSFAQAWLWGRGGSAAGTDGWPVAVDPSGNVFDGSVNFGSVPVMFGSYSLPYVSGTGGFDYQVVIAKYDAYGNFLWANGTQNGNACLVNIATDQSGNLLVLGAIVDSSIQIGTITLTNTIYPATQYFIAKFDPSGTVLWAKNGGSNQGSFFSVYLMRGTTRICGAGGIATDAAGNSYITSNFTLPSVTVGPYTLTNADPSGTTDDILIAKYDSSGNVVWATSVGGAQSDDAYGITVTPAGNVYIAGVYVSPSVTFGSSVITNTTGGSQIAFIAELNSSGTPAWASGSGGTGGEYAAGLAADATNNVYLTGGLSDNSISFSGTSITNPYPGNAVLYLVKFNPSNNIVWSKTIGSATDSAWGYCIATSVCGDVWVSGAMSGSVDIDGHTLSVPAGIVEPVLIAGYTSAGGVTGYSALLSGGDDQTGIACDASGNVYLCSDYQITALPFSIGPDTLADIAASSAYEWMYVAKYSAVVVGIPDTTYMSTDTEICAAEGIVLHAPAGYLAYLWDNDSSGATRTIDSSGTYWVFGSGTCTSPAIIDTFHITLLPVLDTLFRHNDTSVCRNVNIILPAPPGYSSYLWSNGSIANSLTVDSAGIYMVFAPGSCTIHPLIDTYIVDVNNINLAFSLGNDTIICDSLTLQVPIPGGAYHWQDGSTNSSYIATQPGIYYATIINDGCSYTDSITITKGPSCPTCHITIPSAFTPNKDGLNDFFFPIISAECQFSYYAFAIYNRWGQQVFYTQNPNGKWDGTFNGVKTDLDVYMYYVEYGLLTDNSLHIIKGDVTLIR